MMIPAESPLAGSYDPFVVALSVVIAVAASYAALDSRFASRHARFEHLFLEERAQLLHWPDESLIASHPQNIVGPAPPLHLEARVLLLQLPDHIGKLRRAISRLETVPNPRMKHRLQRR
jgi:hypothetical protein